jgi:tetratricopeptide (TPR) repeat protein
VLHATGFARRSATACAATFTAALLLGACSGTTKNTNPDDPTEGDGLPPNVGMDVVFQNYAAVPIEGVVFVPGAMGRPGMVRINPAKKPAVDKQRATYEKATGAGKEVQGQILVTLIYDESKANQDPETAKILLDDAHDILKQMLAAAPNAAAVETLQMATWFEIGNGNYEGAAKIFEEMVARFPDKNLATNKAWLAYCYLRLGRDADAAKLVEGAAATAEDPNTAYVIAWSSFRARKADAARAAITAAARGWKSEGTRPNLEFELVLLLARTGTSLDEAAGVIAEVAAARQYKLLYQLNEAYAASGQPDKAIGALDKATAVAGDSMVKSDAVIFRFRQAEYAYLMNDPVRAAEFAIDTHAKLAGCDDACKANNAEPVAAGMAQFGQFFHTIYAQTLDEKYFEPARKLYEAYIAIPGRPDTEEKKRYLEDLTQVKANAKPEAGVHKEDLMANMMTLHQSRVVGCYEGVLQKEKTLTGSLKFILNIDNTGAVTGVTTEPAPGQEGIPAVGACVEESSKAWRFPGRSQVGVTAVVVTYNFSPKAPAAATP